MPRIKPVLQQDYKDCGICTMQWLIIYYGGFISLEKLREDTQTNQDGTNAFQMVRVLRKWGFDAAGFKEQDILSNKLTFPLIAHLQLENGLEHFVVVKEIKNNKVYLMDPGMGNRILELNNFKNIFTGNLILAKPRSPIIKMDEGITLEKLFKKIYSMEKFLINRVIFFSLIITFLTIIGSYYLKVGVNLINYNKDWFKYLIIAFAIITIIKVGSLYIRNYYINHLENIIDVSIYPEFLRHLFHIPLNNIRSRTIGEIVTRIEELTIIKKFFSDILVSVILDLLMILITIIILFWISPKLVVIMISFMIVYAIYGFLISKSIYNKAMENVNYQTDFNNIIIENITAFESIKNLNIAKHTLEKIENSLAKYFLNNYELNKFINFINLGKEIIIEATFFLINSYGLFLVINNKLNIINLFTFNIILSYGINPIKDMVDCIPKFNYIKVMFNKILELLNIKEEEEKEKINLKGNITFKNVNYSYNHYHLVLKDYNLTIKEGMHVLLEGPSGSGKSTICHLIYKDYLTSSGEVLLDNKNVKDLGINTIRDNITYISQEEELFTGTIKENILVGREVNYDYFFKICKLCMIDEIVKKKSLRYESIIEKTTTNISGGEAQRIILARGLLKRANILILDEALSEVDSFLEAKIIKNIRKFFRNKTIIYISHKNQRRLFENIVRVGS